MSKPLHNHDAPRSAFPDELRPAWYDTFMHRRVLRAGWGILLFILVLVLLILVQTVALRSIQSLQSGPHTILIPHDILGNLIALVAVATATAAVTLLEQREFQDYSFSTRSMGRLFFTGTGSGAAVLCALVLLLRWLGLVSFHGPTVGNLGYVLTTSLVWLGFSAIVAFVEESLTRGYLQYGLTRAGASLLRNYFGARSGVATAFWAAGVLLSIGYGALHGVNAGESALGMATTGLLGLLFVYSLWRTGSLWWALGFHLAWDFSQTFLFGTPSSGLRIRDHLFFTDATTRPTWLTGGDTGPEGSILMFVALLAAFFLIRLLPRRRVYAELWIEAELDVHEQDLDIETDPDPDR